MATRSVTQLYATSTGQCTDYNVHHEGQQRMDQAVEVAKLAHKGAKIGNYVC